MIDSKMISSSTDWAGQVSAEGSALIGSAPQIGEFDQELKKQNLLGKEITKEAAEQLAAQIQAQLAAKLPSDAEKEQTLATQAAASQTQAPVQIQAPVQTQAVAEAAHGQTAGVKSASTQNIPVLAGKASFEGRLTLPESMTLVNPMLAAETAVVGVEGEEAEEVAPPQIQPLFGDAEVTGLDGEPLPQAGSRWAKPFSSQDFLEARLAVPAQAEKTVKKTVVASEPAKPLAAINPFELGAAQLNSSARTPKPVSGQTASLSSVAALTAGIGAKTIADIRNSKSGSQTGTEQDQLSKQAGLLAGASRMAAVQLADGTSFGTEMSAQVTQGSMAKHQLTRESMMNLGSQIQTFGSQGGGEIRLRLKPDHLGEILIQVQAHGNDVGLKIRASDVNSKRIIEDSIASLREQLSVQNLTLASVDVTTVQQGSASQQSGLQNGFDQQNNMNMDLNQKQNSNPQGFEQFRGRDDERGGLKAETVKVPTSLLKGSQARRAGAAGNGRLNVIA